MPFDFSHGGSQANLGLEDIDVSTPFGYMFPTLQDSPVTKLPTENSSEVIQALKNLATAMVERTDTGENNSTIPPGYTYWGQFLDHDITATRSNLDADIIQADFEPQPANVVTANVMNARRPILDLDSIYGDGPGLDESGQPAEASHFYTDGIRLKLGTNTNIGPVPDSALGLDRDVPRGEDKKAIIGDGRNDENTIVSQFHVAMMKFHNAMVDNLAAGGVSQEHLFSHARQLTKWHYQWLVVHDYLKSVTKPGMVDKILFGGETFYNPGAGQVFMPLEFSVAAYRFGHSMVRSQYDFNLNFGRGVQEDSRAQFAQLFTFTGGGGLGGFDTLPTNWIIQWERFFNHHNPFADRFARKIDTRLATPLSQLDNEVAEKEAELNRPLEDMERAIVLHLATRNLLRGYLLSIPTGQHIARMVHATPLTADQLMQDNTPEINAALREGGFLEKTPLWYYVLKEAEVQTNGNSLGEVGSRIVAETIIGLIRSDPNSYMNNNWDPSQGVMNVNNMPITTIEDVLRFAGVM